MLTVLPRRLQRRERPHVTRDDGAVAVEFALLLPLLMLFLFGIIQYGYGLFQLQALSSTVADATQQATTGVTDCTTFADTLQDLAQGNGLNRDDITDVDVQWLTENGTTSLVPDQLGRVKVTVTFTPFKIGLPFVPFPETITRSQTGTMQNIVTLDLPGCNVAL